MPNAMVTKKNKWDANFKENSKNIISNKKIGRIRDDNEISSRP